MADESEGSGILSMLTVTAAEDEKRLKQLEQMADALINMASVDWSPEARIKQLEKDYAFSRVKLLISGAATLGAAAAAAHTNAPGLMVAGLAFGYLTYRLGRTLEEHNQRIDAIRSGTDQGVILYRQLQRYLPKNG